MSDQPEVITVNTEELAIKVTELLEEQAGPMPKELQYRGTGRAPVALVIIVDATMTVLTRDYLMGTSIPDGIDEGDRNQI
jgi:hypothetical protein